ncbi:MAG: TetR/AcrR family transcriptional regulator [Pseudomonadota bacterium]
MKTKERILQTSLDLFNRYGEPSVTTNHIADEMEISPGNLYYHYRNKEDILLCLYERFEEAVLEALQTPQPEEVKLENMWLFLHLLFENIWRYRFFYRDLDHILSKSDRIKRRYSRVLGKKIETARLLCEGLASRGILVASANEIDALSHNMALAASYWLNFQSALKKSHEDEMNARDISLGVYQIMALIAPYLRDEERGMLQSLSRVYLGDTLAKN